MTDDELEKLLDTHLKCHDKLFLDGKLKNNQAVALVREFKNFLVDHPDKRCSNVLDITNFSSLTRIRLIRDLTAAVNEKLNADENYDPGLDDPLFTLVFEFHNRIFLIELRPTDDQPGNGVVTPGYAYSYVLKNFEQHGGCPQTVQEGLLNSRENPSIISPVNSHNGLNLNALNLLLDFEVARRLQESNPRKELDEIPVASAVAGSLLLNDDYFKMSLNKDGPYCAKIASSRKNVVKNFVRELFSTNGIEKSDDVNDMYTKVFGVDEAEPPVTPPLTPPVDGTAEPPEAQPPVVIETQQTTDEGENIDEVTKNLDEKMKIVETSEGAQTTKKCK